MMKIHELYEKNITRRINPAVVVSEMKDKIIDQEIEEYIFTDDIVHNIYKFLNAIVNTKEGKTGIWISGYYGSGKSHFIKYIFYCLNKQFREAALDNFTKAVRNMPLLDDLTISQATLLKSKLDSLEIEEIIFNIDAVSTTNDGKDRITRVLLHQLNSHRGYNSINIALALYLEKHLDNQGKFEAFKEKVHEQFGEKWDDSNISNYIHSGLSSIIDVARQLDPHLDRDSLHSAIKNPNQDYSIEHLIYELKDYLKTKGENFRLLFLMDEVSQYIGSDSTLLLNLQTIVEEIGSKIGTKVWIACTAQQDLANLINNTPEDFIREYTTDLYKVDTGFRKAIIAYEKVRKMDYQMDDDAILLFEELNKRYDNFLVKLNVEWQKVLKDKQFDFHKINVDKQFDFYKKHLKDFEYKIVVIISDAFRYELGKELCNDLLEEGKLNVEVIPNLASVPSYTNLGMSNLLPNEGMTVEASDSSLSFRIGAKTTVSTNRAAILQSVEPASATIGFVEAMSLDLKKGREFFKENRIVYIYHDWIDAVGDKRGTQHETFEATSKAVQDIKALLGKLSSWNVRHARVTSDHGFLYNHKEIKTHNREKLPATKGFSNEHVRCVVAEEFDGAIDGYLMDLRNTTNLNTDLKVLVPRATNRYHIQGNVGLQFVHGGASLQELLTPVLVVHRVEKDENETVTFKVVEKTERIVSNFMKITLLQDQPVSNELKNNELVFAIYSETGELLSNEVEVNLNSTFNNPKERVFEVVLYLNSKGSSSSFGRVKAFKKNNTMRINTDGMNDTVMISSIIEKDDF